jgi:uncharacterized protein Yka (UPF0111/DUF47 family)
MTGLDREDIAALANALYAITRSVVQFWDRYSLAEHRLESDELRRLAATAEQSAAGVAATVKQLRQFDRRLQLAALNDQLEQAGRLASQALQPLYRGGADALQAVILQDLCGRLEQIVGDCSRAAQVAAAIALKGL